MSVVTGEYVLPKKDLLEKAAASKGFEYSPLRKDLKKKTDIANKKKQYQKDKKEEDETKEKKYVK